MTFVDDTMTIQIKAEEDKCYVFLDKTQYRQDSLEIIKEYITVHEQKDGLQLIYNIPEATVSLRSYQEGLRSRFDKLKLAEKVVEALVLPMEYKIPFIDPDNIYTDGERVFLLHFGLKGLVFPQDYDEEETFHDIKSIVVSLFHPTLEFKKLRLASLALDDSFSKKITQIESVTELLALLRSERLSEQKRMKETKSVVSKKLYNFYRISGIVALFSTVVVSIFLYSYYTNYQKQEAIINAQASFMTNRYSQVQKDLEKYEPTKLPKSAKYVLAISSIELTDLTEAQKQAILNNISLKSDDNTLNYWAYTGRGKFEKALDLAQNLGDEQLILLAYTNLYQSIKLDNKMDGAKKQSLLAEYSKQIEELSSKVISPESSGSEVKHSSEPEVKKSSSKK
ncbi:type VII secretion protein EssB [Streptococcus cuniculi]|uniref:Type VII secretion protein EssB n=1 Tax=Streptococcus cuniculi TaxID=1432788 RepID=A0A4Y9JBY4_9STRE|nr:type VII secretion protein EssB [Streptococcus cuniculi]MBF0777454.1 type VII secretion protein EssB [Streptococcus cuniculi]TFU98510.1 type VII secretion protein EssB [Streptococcus cuniculi]